MSTYTQWRAAVDRGDVRRVTWVCGSQRILVEEVIDTICAQLRTTELDQVRLTAGDIPDDRIWSTINQHPLTGRRLILIRDVEKIGYWQPLIDWLADAQCIPGVHLLLVSNDAEFTTTGPDGTRTPAPHIAAIMARRRLGQVVRCATPNPTDAVAWVRRRGALADDQTAAHLLTRVGGDFRAAAWLADKLALFGGRAGPGVIDELCEQTPASTFAESLIMLRKRDAVVAAPTVGLGEYGRVVGLLDARLDVLSAICGHIRAGSTPREMNPLPHFLVRAYLPIAKHYDQRRCDHIRRVLAVLDNALRRGARDGLLEALVALW